MIRTLRALSLTAAAAAAVYMVSSYASSPDRMPMQWDLHNRPTWSAPKAAFYGMFAGALLFGVALTFLPRTAPAGAALAVCQLFLFHVCRQAATGGRFFAVPVGSATVLVVLVTFGAAAVTVVQALRSAKSPGAGGPPPARPRAS
jgi:hypothetical protein